MPEHISSGKPKFEPPIPLPEPKPHPIQSDELIHRFVRASMLSQISVDYARQAQAMVETHLTLENPYRGNTSVPLLIITAVRESLRATKAIIDTSDMDEFFAQEIRERVAKFEGNHPHVKQARDVIAHVDAYISSEGRDPDQWFDTTNRFGDNLWVFRVGNKLDIDMVKFVSEIVALANYVRRVFLLWFNFEHKLDPASRLVEELIKIGIYTSVRVSNGVAEVTILKVGQPTDTDDLE